MEVWGKKNLKKKKKKKKNSIGGEFILCPVLSSILNIWVLPLAI